MRGRHSSTLLLTVILSACGGGGGSGDSGGSGDGTGPGADTVAPSTPAGVAVAATSASSINLSWQAATDDTGVVGYRIYRDGALLETIAATTTDDVGLVTGVNYCYEISAVDAANNESSRSTSRCATPAEVWTQRVPSADIVVEEIIFNGTEYLAIGDPSLSTNYVLKSTDGLTWAAHKTDAQVLQLEDVVWTGSAYIAASGRSLYYVSADGIDWTTFLFPTALNDIHAIAWSGSLAVVVGDAGSVLSTTDGTNWTEHTGITTNDLFDVDWVNNRFVAVGANGTVLISPDGSTWSVESTGGADSLATIAWNGATYLAMGSTGAYTSSDGVSWAPVVINGIFEDVVWADALNLFVAVDTNGRILTSPDGMAWTERTDLDQFFSLDTIFWDGTQLIAGGDYGEIVTSSDGISWVTRASAVDFERVRSDGTTLYAVGGPSKLATSSDGITWSYHRTGYSGDFMHDIASSGTRLLAAAQTYYMSTPPDLTSPWPVHDWIGATSHDYSVVWDGSRFVSVGSDGGIRISTDGISYTYVSNVDTGTSEPLRSIIFTGTQYVVVGNSGTVLTSPDLSTWTSSTSGTTATLYEVAYSGATYVAVGSGGTILVSPDAISWSAATSNTTNALYGVTWAGDEFVAVGSGTTALSSPDGVGWTDFSDGLPLNAYHGVHYTGDRLVVVGDNGAILTREKP